MRAGVTSLSWIPSELVRGPFRVPFDLGLTHYDSPPPDHLDDLEALRRAGRFRFVNHVEAQVEVSDGRITSLEVLPATRGVIGMTNLFGGAVRFPAVPMPDLVTQEVAEDGRTAVVRQTAGGRAPLPAPRRVQGRPRLVAPLVWTTLELTLRADGTSSHRVVGASRFPRHWVYDGAGDLVEKVATTDSTTWLHAMTEAENPWRGVDEEVLTAPAETGLERRLSVEVMGRRPHVERLAEGEHLFRQGDEGDALALVLDGVLEVSRDGAVLGRTGPGAVVGERALLEGARTATVTAVTDVTVALVPGGTLADADLRALVEGHRREDDPAADDPAADEGAADEGAGTAPVG